MFFFLVFILLSVIAMIGFVREFFTSGDFFELIFWGFGSVACVTVTLIIGATLLVERW